jgi:hypothetical protein
MLSYIFGYTEEVKEVLKEDSQNQQDEELMLSSIFGYTEEVLKEEDVKKINILDSQNQQDEELMYKSHTKNYELNKQIRRVATKIKLNKCTPNVYKEDYSYLDQKEPIKKRIIKRHKRHDSLESVYEVVQRFANHEQLEKETNNDMYGTNTSPTTIKKNRRR